MLLSAFSICCVSYKAALWTYFSVPFRWKPLMCSRRCIAAKFLYDVVIDLSTFPLALQLFLGTFFFFHFFSLFSFTLYFTYRCVF